MYDICEKVRLLTRLNVWSNNNRIVFEHVLNLIGSECQLKLDNIVWISGVLTFSFRTTHYRKPFWMLIMEWTKRRKCIKKKIEFFFFCSFDSLSNFLLPFHGAVYVLNCKNVVPMVTMQIYKRFCCILSNTLVENSAEKERKGVNRFSKKRKIHEFNKHESAKAFCSNYDTHTHINTIFSNIEFISFSFLTLPGTPIYYFPQQSIWNNLCAAERLKNVNDSNSIQFDFLNLHLNSTESWKRQESASKLHKYG